MAAVWGKVRDKGEMKWLGFGVRFGIRARSEIETVLGS